jgi:hypothetical protein
MLFKFNGQEIQVPDDFILKCGEHAEARGITLEEYIAEAFTMYKKQLDKEKKSESEIMQDELEPITHDSYAIDQMMDEGGMDYSGAFESDIEE